jgi:hypothetical protein
MAKRTNKVKEFITEREVAAFAFLTYLKREIESLMREKAITTDRLSKIECETNRLLDEYYEGS